MDAVDQRVSACSLCSDKVAAAGWAVQVLRHRQASRIAEFRRNVHVGSVEAPDVRTRRKV